MSTPRKKRTPKPKPIAGEVEHPEEPDWVPLYRHVGPFLADWFMYMHAVRLADGTRLHAYKHVDTRRYFHLHDDGRSFAYVDDDLYLEFSSSLGIFDVLRPWCQLDPEDDEEKEMYEMSMRLAGYLARRRRWAAEDQRGTAA